MIDFMNGSLNHSLNQLIQNMINSGTKHHCVLETGNGSVVFLEQGVIHEGNKFIS